MKFAAAFLLTTTLLAEPASDVSLRIHGSVAKPGIYSLPLESATLALLLEQADGITRLGSDHISVTTRVDGKEFTIVMQGSDFYAQDRDYTLPSGTSVVVPECVGLGLGNLSPEEYTRLQQRRSEYLERKRTGKITVHQLLPEKAHEPK